MKDFIENFLRLFFPEQCRICGTPLLESELCVCRRCDIRLPRTRFHLKQGNAAEQCFYGKVDIERVASFGYFRKDNDLRRIIHRMKYHDAPHTAYLMGKLYARELMHGGWHTDVDLLVPVPLHPLKEMQRGYNQSEQIARGIGSVWGTAVETRVLRKRRHNGSQTTRSLEERYENTLNVFKARRGDLIEGRHVVLVDDVLTSGSTLEACAHALHAVANVRISVLTIGFAGEGPGV